MFRMKEVTRILNQIEQGNQQASDELLPLVYEDLRRLAAAKLAREKPGQTLQPTALLHDAFIRLVGSETPPQWSGRQHFFAAAAEAMRRILVEQARKKSRIRHGGELRRVDLDCAQPVAPSTTEEILAVHESLDALESENPEAAAVVKLRYFGGMTIPEVAEATGVSPRQVDKLWAYARAWLLADLKR